MGADVPIISDSWYVVEAWTDGTAVFISVDGQPAGTAPARDLGISTEFRLFIQGAFTGVFTALGICDHVPDIDEREAARAWATSLIPNAA